MQEEHKERRIKTVMSLKRDLELNEVELFRCVICTFISLYSDYSFIVYWSEYIQCV